MEYSFFIAATAWGFIFIVLWAWTEAVGKSLFDASSMGAVLTASAAFSLIAGWLERFWRAIDNAEPERPTVSEVAITGIGGAWVIVAVGLSIVGAARG